MEESIGMELMHGLLKEEHTNYVVYYIEYLSDELKQEIRSRLVSVCHGADQAKSASKIYSYKATVKEFIRRYKTDQDNSVNRKKGMIGELLVHIILEIEGRFSVASPFFNMEERSFKKGYDVALFDPSANDLWIAEVKSGEKQKSQANASSAIVGLINTAKNDLKNRLNEESESLWLNAMNAARVSMNSSSHQKDAVIKLLEACANEAVDGNNSSELYNVVLAGVLFHPLSERMDAAQVEKKYIRIVDEKLFNQVIVVAIQKSTFEAVYAFLESEAQDED